jgi:mannose-6-phosphate isomerase-like protein (cupin superfamily)
MSHAPTALSRYSQAAPYATKDGSQIRELMHPAVHGNANQSLAEATVAPATQTALHRHHRTEEIYHITAGSGLMTLGEETFPVAAGDTVLIAPRTPHRIRNTGDVPLRLLCCCAPAYSHDDTELLETEGP